MSSVLVVNEISTEREEMTRALEAMRRFRVPRGAQVWEVHQEIPDIRAAALAVEAYQKAYEITGDSRYLDDASYWAWTGVPFIYYGEEIGMDGGGDPDCRRPMIWDETRWDTETRSFYKKLIERLCS